ncbi:MAG: hypothetical protein AB7O67_05475 [Vicinamibacterales bacterium]
MGRGMARFTLWLLVILVGMQLGAALFEARVIVPLWSGAPPESVSTFYLDNPLRPDATMHWWIYTAPAVGVLALFNIFFAWGTRGEGRGWWLLGSFLALAAVAFGFLYSMPTLLTLSDPRLLTPEVVVSTTNQWVTMNYLRAGVYFVAWLCILAGFRSGAPKPDRW